MNRNNRSHHHGRKQKNNKFAPPTRNGGGSGFPTKPFRPRFLSKASRGVNMQAVPGLQQGAQSQDLPQDCSRFPPDTLQVKAGGIQTCGRWNCKESEQRAHQHPQLLRQFRCCLAGLRDCQRLCLACLLLPHPPPRML